MPTTQPLPSPSSSATRPSVYYRQHHEVAEPRIDNVAFQPGWKVRTRLDRLLLEKLISFREWQVAVWYRQTYERAFASELASSAGRLDVPGRAPYYRGRQNPREQQLEAIAYLRHVRTALGPTITGLLESCAVSDLSWTAIGRKQHVCARTARRWVVESIKLLARV
jgi:hypothetical protein